jgi:hypothetical protein
MLLSYILKKILQDLPSRDPVLSGASVEPTSEVHTATMALFMVRNFENTCTMVGWYLVTFSYKVFMKIRPSILALLQYDKHIGTKKHAYLPLQNKETGLRIQKH